jgi:DUF1680 family protein
MMKHRTARRQTLLILLTGSLIPMQIAASSPVPEYDASRVHVLPRVPLRAEPFSLRDVRLLDGPFKHAMEMDGKYLLELEPDRLLHRFRLSAGLQPKAPIYGGWESQGIAGHTLGHYLSACSMMYAASGDVRYRQRVEYIVDELALCQSRRADGYVGGIPDADRIFKEVSEGNIRSQGFDLNGGWVPWYTLHKLFAGLIDAYDYCDSQKAKAVAIRLADWAIQITSKLTDEQWQKMLACEHGGMNEALASLYAITGETKYLDLSRKFYHKAILDRLAEREDQLAGHHGNTQIPKVIGMARLYELTGNERDRTIAAFFWDRVVHHHSYVIGGHGSGEYFGQPDQLANRLTPTTCETCNTYNMLKLTRHLFSWDPRAEYIDFYERALYNHILASQDPGTGMMCYYVSLQPGHYKTYSTPDNSFWCCVGTGIENHVKYGDTIYFHDRDSLYLNMFIPSMLHWKEKGLTLRQETRFPQEDTTRLAFTCNQPVELILRVRCPSWMAGSMSLKVNGRAQKIDARPGEYAALSRRWKSGDRVEIRIPKRLREEPMPDNPDRVALLDGPIVLAGDLGPQSEPRPGARAAGDGTGPRVPVFVTGEKPLQEWVQPVAGKPLAFQTQEVGRPADVSLIPFYQMHHERYSVYWDLFTEAAWKQREAEYRAEEARQRELAARTVDYLAIGEMQPERDHHVQGEKTGAGEFGDRKWRHAVGGGWFSFEMRVLPDQPADLVLTYWGSDSGGREFDVLVDGTPIATQMLQNNQPGRFFDVTHPLPEALTRGKEKVTVRLQAHPGRIAGGLFGARTVRRAGSDTTE